MKRKDGAASPQEGGSTVASNKKARREYEILDVLEAGISLVGAEVKSIREGGVSLRESYVRIKNDEVFLVGCHISPYSHSQAEAYEPTRDRKLLLHRREIEKLRGRVIERGLTLVPLRMYFHGGVCKVEIAVARGRKLYDKREAVKADQARRAIARSLAGS